MIAKGNPHNSGPYLARYLAASSKGNEISELAELRGFASDNIFDAFSLAQLMAEGTHCQKPLFHVQVRTPQGEELTPEQWGHVADRIEKQLGFTDQPRAVVFHQKDGHKHMHLVWSRIDAETMHAIDPGLYKRKLKEICRKLEKEMGLQQVRNEREPGEKTQPAARPEFEQSRRLKTDVKAIREGIRDCWDMSENGAGFLAALEKDGLILAKGERRSFVVVDEMGGYHALGKRITGATAEQTRVRLADIEATRLPTVDTAKAIQRERREQEKGAMSDQKEMTDEDRTRKRIQKVEEAIKEAIKEENEHINTSIADDNKRRDKEIAEEDEKRQEANREDDRKRQEAFKEAAERAAAQQAELEARERAQALSAATYREQREREFEQLVREEDERRQVKAQALEIREAPSRYAQAVGMHYNVKDPYGSMSRAAMEEYRLLMKEQEALNSQIARAKDPKEREALEMRKRIEGNEYMATTCERIATQSEIIVGRFNTDEATHRRELAAAYRYEAKELRTQFHILQTERSKEAHAKIYGDPKEQKQEKEAAELSPEQPGPRGKSGKDKEAYQKIVFEKDAREAWQESMTGPGFENQLKERGYILARDENGVYDFTVAGGHPKIAAVARNGYAYRLDPARVGAGKETFTERISKIKPDGLPNLGEAREMQKSIRENGKSGRQEEAVKRGGTREKQEGRFDAGRDDGGGGRETERER